MNGAAIHGLAVFLASHGSGTTSKADQKPRRQSLFLVLYDFTVSGVI
jgi:hypothetical protein